MTGAQFEALVRTLEAQAQRDPRGYQLKVVLLALLGDAYLVAMVALIVAAFAGSIALVWVLHAVALKLVVVIGAFLWIVLRALWVRIGPPKGIAIGRREAPDLFELIDALSSQSRAPRVHHVLISGDLNAGVVQQPRLGVFGLPRNFLVIGLPLMKSLTIEQFKAVLAHEFGHLAGGHGSVSSRIYRQRLRWARLLAVLEASRSKAGFLFKPFLSWFAPYFNAYTFPMARANEYQADASAVRITSAAAAAEALTAVDVVGGFLGERYWAGVYQGADTRPQPAGLAPFSDMSHGLATGLDSESTTLWMGRAMANQTSLADTHPALRDRLDAIGQPPRLAPPSAGQAADRLLGASLANVTDDLDRRWRSETAPLWEKRHRQVQQARQRLAELDVRCEGEPELPLQEALERATLTQTPGGRPDEALAQLHALHLRFPDSWEVCLRLGGCLLQRDDGTGSALVERAMQLDPGAAARGCQALMDYCRRKGREEEARAWQQRLIEAAKVQAEDTRERNRLSSSDTFEPHGLADETVAALRAQLQATAVISVAHVVRKHLANFPQRPLYVMCFEERKSARFGADNFGPRALEAIRTSVRFPGETIVIDARRSEPVLVAKICYVQGARIL